MLAGHFHISQMVPMTKSKLLLRQVSAHAWLNSYCEYRIFFLVDQYLSFSLNSNQTLLGKSHELSLICSHPSPSVLIPALRTVGNIVTGDDMQTQVFRI